MTRKKNKEMKCKRKKMLVATPTRTNCMITYTNLKNIMKTTPIMTVKIC